MHIRMDTIPKKWAVIPLAFFQMIVLSINYYIVPQFVIFKVCHEKYNDTVCNQLGQSRFKEHEDHVYNEAAAWNALINFAGFFPALIMILPLGAMTDLVSKRKVLLLLAIANLVSSLINLCSSIFTTLHMGFLVLASFVTCVFGEFPGCIMLCCTYAASASSDDRTFIISIVIVSVDTGFGVGSFVGSYLVRYFGFPSTFLFASTTLFVSLLYTLMFIPPIDDGDEKFSHGEQDGVWNGVKRHTKETAIHLVSFMKKHLLHSKDNTILLLLIAVFFNYTTNGGERALVPFFLKHSPLNFQADKIGIYLMLLQCGRVVGLIILALITKICFPDSDYTLMFIGTLTTIISFSVLSFSKTTLMVYLSTVLVIPTAFMSPSVRSKLTKLVSSEEHGVVLSCFGLLTGLSMFITSVAANGLFVATVKIYSGFSLLLMSMSNVVSLLILCYILIHRRSIKVDTNDYNKICNKDEKL